MLRWLRWLCWLFLCIMRGGEQGKDRAWAERRRRAWHSACPAFEEEMGRRIDLVVSLAAGDLSGRWCGPRAAARAI